MYNSNKPYEFETFRNNSFNNIPEVYGDNKIVLMVRDPWTIYSYWEINDEVERNVKNEISKRGLKALKSILRVYSVENKDFELRDWANTWYVHVDETGKSWLCDIGILCTNKEFFCLARSNVVKTPAGRMSEKIGNDWIFKELYEISGGENIGRSSLELREILEKHLRSWMSSGAVSSLDFGSSDHFKESK
jgi:hypothetical protein